MPDIRYNPCYVQLFSGLKGEKPAMMNFHSKKSKQILAIIIIVVLVIAMVIPALAYAFG